jgi:glutaredoxin-like YruB-family protein
MAKSVTIYSTPTCHFCQAAKAFFDEHGVAFTEHNVADDLEKRKEMVDKSGQMGVPVIIIDDETVIGFDEDHLSRILEL